MLYKMEDMPALIDEVKGIITAAGQDPSTFEIEVIEDPKYPNLRVATYTDNGGFMVRLYADHDIDNLKKSLTELFG